MLGNLTSSMFSMALIPYYLANPWSHTNSDIFDENSMQDKSRQNILNLSEKNLSYHLA